MVEHRPFKAGVDGSSPSALTILVTVYHRETRKITEDSKICRIQICKSEYKTYF